MLTFGANSDLFAALVSFCVSVVRGFVVRPLFSLFQATYRFKSVQVSCAKLKPNAGNSAKIRLIFYAYNTVARGVIKTFKETRQKIVKVRAPRSSQEFSGEVPRSSRARRDK